ncbi:MAG: tetratricopeptide repeat protein [Vicinamibacterales bacterium]
MPSHDAATVRFGPFTLDTRSRELIGGARTIRLQDQPFEVLRMLLARPGQVVTRADLQRGLWPDGTFVDFEHSLNAAVKRLRTALGDDAEQPRYIETLPRLGYRFVAPVAATIPAPAPARIADGTLRLAVLPFTTFGGASDPDYFTDGLTEELIAQLALTGRGRLAVIARGSSMACKGTTERARTVGRALGVDYLVEGSVRRDGERVRIVARLVEAASEATLWVETFERQLTESLSVQADVAARTAQSLAIELGQARRSRAVAPDTLIPCLKARQKGHQRTEAGFREAVKLYEEALEHDPTYGPAYVGLAEGLGMLANYGIVPPADVRARALGAIEHALAIDPESADAHRALAFLHWQFAFAWDEAIAGYERALALNPQSPDTVYWYGLYLGVIGRFERSYALLDRAAELDPLSLLVPSVQGWVRFFARRFEDALPFYRRVLNQAPDHHVALWFLGQALVELAQFDEGLAALGRALELSARSARQLGYLGYAYGRAGREDDARACLAELDQRADCRYVPPYFPALVLSGLDRADDALDRLEQAHGQSDTMLRDLLADPSWDRLRGTARFTALMRAMAFPARLPLDPSDGRT